jgi:hypothetical protein
MSHHTKLIVKLDALRGAGFDFLAVLFAAKSASYARKLVTA